MSVRMRWPLAGTRGGSATPAVALDILGPFFVFCPLALRSPT